MDRDRDEGTIEVELSDTQGHLHVDPAELASLVRAVLAAEGHTRATVSIALVDGPSIHALNRSHLGHDWPTDVISFPLSEPDEPVLAGELIVSAEMAATTAAEIGVDPRDELALYIVHGLLHLCGYDDLSDTEAARMRRREGELLAALGRPNPFDLAMSPRPGRVGREGTSAVEESAGPAPVAPTASQQREPSPWSS